MKKIREGFEGLSFFVLLALALLTSMGAAASAQTAAAPTANPTANPQMQESDTRQWQVAEFDKFLDSHPEIAEQLRKDPSLVNNDEFVEHHSALKEYLQKHPGIREEIRENPNAFMGREERYDRNEDRREGREGRRDRDDRPQQVAVFDRFLDNHPEVAEQLRKDPTLVNNKEFLEQHPALQQYMHEHPEMGEEVREHPNAFMHAEERYDRNEDRDRDRGDHASMVDRDRREPYTGRDRDDVASFGEFLGAHSNVAQQLSKDPSLINNKEFMESHPDLREYINAHPNLQAQLATNPQGVMSTVKIPNTTNTNNPMPKPNQKQ